jgi:parvulin-like peptidyl-prolyl isomerase
MLKRIIIFVSFLGLITVSSFGCGKHDTANLQSSSESTEQNFAKIHKNVDFSKEDKDKMHETGLSTESGGHGMSTVNVQKEIPDPNKVIATINNEKILRKDLDLILDRFKDHVNPSALESMEQQITEQLVGQSLLRQFVTEKNLTVNEEIVDKEIAKMRENIKKNPATKDKTLEDFLKYQGSNIDELRTAIRMSAAIEQYAYRSIDDKKLEDYFIKNISDFNSETVTASHILIDTQDMKPQDEFDKAMAKIVAIKKEIDNGADFPECAKKYSDCPTGKSGGDLGSFPRHGVMVEEFANAAFAAEVGKVSDPVKTQFGYHLIKVTAHSPPKDVSFGDVKDKVRETLVAIEITNLLKDLRAKAKVVITL